MIVHLIPRVSVNYNFKDLITALFVSERKCKYKEKCKEMLSLLFGNEVILLVPSARDAIYELLIRLPQKKVVIPAYTCIAVNEAVLLAGKEFTYSKTGKDSYNSDYLECIEPDTIVLATHQYGLPCRIEEIAMKCRKTGAVLIEDCATSMGTMVNEKMTGTFGDYAVVSFNASKLLNVPPFGGALIGKNAEMLKRIEAEAEWKCSNIRFKLKGLIRGLAFVLTKNTYLYKLFHFLTIQSKGKFQKTEHEKPAERKTALYSYKFTEWQASILLKQLKCLNQIFKKRRELYRYYDEHISNPLVKKPIVDEDAICCRYAVLVEKRNDFYHECVKKGIDMDFSHCSLGCPDSYEEEHKMAQQILNIPFNTNLTEREIKNIVNVVNGIKL